jgi:hypothetical protein
VTGRTPGQGLPASIDDFREHQMDQSVLHDTVAQATSAGRHDLYQGIHKALRLCMTRTLTDLGCMDPADDADVACALERTHDMLALCALHIEDENRFIHPVLQARAPGSAERTAGDHVGHEQAIAALHACAGALRNAAGPARAAAARQLYRRMALFVAENLEHMHFEETHNMAVLWSTCSDDELMAIEHAIVASIPPALMARCLHWMLPALPHPDRVGMLLGMRGDAAPPGVFDATLAIARGRLDARDLDKLEAALAAT